MERTPVPYAVIDAFTSTPFKGNPAAICLLEEERDYDWLLAVAREFNISETAFLLRAAAGESGIPRFHIRWFTPVVEVDLCGHATLAGAHFLFSSGMVRGGVVEFLSRSGVLSAKRIDKATGLDGDGASIGVGKGRLWIELDFPAISVNDCKSEDDLSIPKTLNGEAIVDMKMAAGCSDLIVELSSGKVVADVLPNFDELAKCPVQGGVIITGLAPPGSGYDICSRYFCPKLGINEDPVCGSAHCALVNYWSKKLGKSDFIAYQASSRGGVLDLHLDVETQRVLMRGEAVTVMKGSLLG